MFPFFVFQAARREECEALMKLLGCTGLLTNADRNVIATDIFNNNTVFDSANQDPRTEGKSLQQLFMDPNFDFCAYFGEV